MSKVDFAGQAVIVTVAGRGLGRLYALDIARRLPEISATQPFSVPGSLFDEVRDIRVRSGVTG